MTVDDAENGQVLTGKTADWTPEEEAIAVRKVDWYLIPWLILSYTALNIDRGNIGNAAIMNTDTPAWSLYGQLELVGSQFNWAVSAFFFGYVLFEIPSNFMLTKVNPSRWLSRIMVSWGLLAACLGAVQNYTGLVVVRVLVGSMEAGFAPGVALYLSFWYKKFEVSGRWATMYGGAYFVSSFGGLIAYGVANMNGAGGVAGWRWLFILEGLVSALIGVATWFYLPDYPQTARFLSHREREIIVGRLPPTAPSLVAKDLVTADVWDELKDWRLYTMALALTLELCTGYAISYFMPTVIKSMGFTSTNAQLLSVAPSVWTSICIIVVNYTSDRYQEKAIHLAFALVPPIIGYFLLATIQPQLSPPGRYGLLFLPSVASSSIPLIVGFGTISSKGTTRHAFRSAFILACGSIGGAVGGQIYQIDDQPLYIRGHFINGSFLIAVLVLFLAAYWSIVKDGEYVGRRANLTVREYGGLELDGQVAIKFDSIVDAK